MSASSIAKSIIYLFQAHGNMEYGEQVTQISHAMQAGMLAREQGLDDELVAAAFLHDIGHLVPLEQPDKSYERMGDFGMEAHDKWGEQYLRKHGFSDRLIATVRNHVDAKRYLCAVDETYYAALSDASKETLRYQGGTMEKGETKAFEQSPFFAESIQIRRIDELAKEIDFTIQPSDWDYFEGLVARQLPQ